MREIKFRFWDAETDRYEDQQPRMRYWPSIPQEISLEAWLNSLVPKMQFTGLLDKNGKEIYFDDILEYSFDDADASEGGTALVVRTMNNGAGIQTDYKDPEPQIRFAVQTGGEIQDLWDDPELWTTEVIGNIYQNPELLK